jgi:hypothetical protein
MAGYPPFMNAYGMVSKILEKAKKAKTPDRFTQDFLQTKLGFKSVSAKAFIPLAKRLGLLASDGVPTDLYKSFRNPSLSGGAMARAIKKGYSELFARNEYAHDLKEKDLHGLLIEITGLEKGHQTLRVITGTFNSLKTFAKFEDEGKEIRKEEPEEDPEDVTDYIPLAEEELKLNLSYTP